MGRHHELSGQQRTNSVDATCLFQSKAPSAPPTAYSYVEGNEYENDWDEIEALGGDPFFLDTSDSIIPGANTESDLRSNLQIMGDETPDDAWDGREHDDAYFD